MEQASSTPLRIWRIGTPRGELTFEDIFEARLHPAGEIELRDAAGTIAVFPHGHWWHAYADRPAEA
jgi:hypothetical protein